MPHAILAAVMAYSPTAHVNRTEYFVTIGIIVAVGLIIEHRRR